MRCQTVVVPPGGRPATKERPPHKRPVRTREPITLLAGRPGHLDHGIRPCVSLAFLTLLLGIARRRFRRRFTAPWDANSTSVCWACQEGIPIYCISVLTLGMPASNPVLREHFPQPISPGLMPASLVGGKACVSIGIWGFHGVGARVWLPAPWSHRCPQRFHGVRCGWCRRETRPDSLLCNHGVRARRRPLEPMVG